MTDLLRDRIAAVMRREGWTCEYHEPVSDFGECGQCDDSHRRLADRVIAELRSCPGCDSAEAACEQLRPERKCCPDCNHSGKRWLER